ncbi:hypothetical protein NP439_04010 [Oceanobacillus jeddahense]|uniref:Uncharacterized protein n=1 Tax=Oceanobacillus jeddahense TaxID=1462527 RepID=A0ABY5JWR9_9BACI|nr:hypothetical protein [Oceanobacillus jeddahense]UUI03867.1 hypothetical protein NP439_04010 [Oceanobacillus jeddahense]
MVLTEEIRILPTSDKERKLKHEFVLIEKVGWVRTSEQIPIY